MKCSFCPKKATTKTQPPVPLKFMCDACAQDFTQNLVKEVLADPEIRQMFGLPPQMGADDKAH
jgi:hypothetical protein